MAASHLDFHKSSEPARSPCLTELTQNQWIASPKLGGEDPGKEIAFPYAGYFEVLHWFYKGQEVVGVVAVGLEGLAFQVDFPFFLHEGLQALLYQGFDPLLHFLLGFPRGFRPL